MSARNAVVACAWKEGAEGARSLEEALGLARRAARALGAPLHALVLGSDAGAAEAARAVAARLGAAELLHVDLGGRPATPDLLVAALAQTCAQEAPRLLVVPQGGDGRVVGARLAARTGAAVSMNVVEVEAAADGSLQVTATAYGGDTRVVYALAGAAAPVLGASPSAPRGAAEEVAETAPVLRRVAVDLAAVDERVRVLEPARREGPRLEEARVVVSGGRGLGSAENFKLVEELAAALGGMAGASRPIVDEGWVDAARQVGLTGRITRPELYVAIGISGASQHMAGCSAAKTIVAVNRDPDAAIFRYARFGVVGDCLELLPELIRAARAR
ncbi:MAG: electron transfer flavoprotein subunit alpha/FixB family protein [Deltaproteobacteria bacterium]|nr:electron transfer flavoprotein subunit alpha/FixB family protein [Deltaproteobacteria bacterium]